MLIIILSDLFLWGLASVLVGILTCYLLQNFSLRRVIFKRRLIR